MRLKCISLISLLVVATMRGQTVAPSADQSLPTFQSKVPVVLVDIVVTDQHGNPIRAALRFSISDWPSSRRIQKNPW